MQESHSPQASPSGVGARQLIVRANMRAQEVLPTPRGPQKRYAWASRPEEIEFFSVAVRFFCPTTVANDAGRYLRALTIYCEFSLIADVALNWNTKLQKNMNISNNATISLSMRYKLKNMK
jgi:hypothetical protein